MDFDYLFYLFYLIWVHFLQIPQNSIAYKGSQHTGIWRLVVFCNQDFNVIYGAFDFYNSQVFKFDYNMISAPVKFNSFHVLLVFRVYYERPVVIDSLNLKLRQTAWFSSNKI